MLQGLWWGFRSYEIPTDTAPDEGERHHAKQQAQSITVGEASRFQIKAASLERLVHVFRVPAPGVAVNGLCTPPVVRQIEDLAVKVLAGKNPHPHAIDRHSTVPAAQFTRLELLKTSPDFEPIHARGGMQSNGRLDPQTLQREKPVSADELPVSQQGETFAVERGND